MITFMSIIKTGRILQQDFCVGWHLKIIICWSRCCTDSWAGRTASERWVPVLLNLFWSDVFPWMQKDWSQCDIARRLADQFFWRFLYTLVDHCGDELGTSYTKPFKSVDSSKAFRFQSWWGFFILKTIYTWTLSHGYIHHHTPMIVDILMRWSSNDV